ncbi:MAG: GntR family transcriptional regulator [Dehalococcoidia bacterium]
MAKRQVDIVQADRLRDQIYSLVKADIREGALRLGKKLTEIDVAERYGISRTPVREALCQLTNEGLLVESKKGYALPIHSAEEIRERLELRALIDPALLRHACEDRTTQQLKALMSYLDEEKASVDEPDSRRFIAANTKFRDCILEMCGNKLLAQCSQLYDDQFQCFRDWGMQYPKHRHFVTVVHEQLCTAIWNRDSAMAKKTALGLIKHIESLLEEYEESLVRDFHLKRKK